LVYNSSGLVAYYFAGDLNNEVPITLATATLGTYASGGFIAVDNANMPGWYEIGIPDAALDGGNEVAIQLRGATNMAPVNIYIELDAVDYQTDAFGALKPTNAGRTLDVTATGAAGIDLGNVENPTTTLNLSGTTLGGSVGSINGVTFPSNFGVLGINDSGHLLRLVLCDTTTTNSDMRGTDGAALASHYTAGRAQYLENLNVGGPVASQADINALNQSASRRVTLATVMQYERPEAGSTSYTVEARTYDGDGNPVNADSAPTLTATGSVTGSLSGNLSAATNPATGVYRWMYTVANTATVEPVRYDLSATISAATFTQSAFTQVTDLVSITWTSTDASRLLAVFNKLPSRAYLAGATSATGELVPGDILNQLPSAGWADGSFGDRLLVGATNQRDVNVTGSGHVAASVHSVEPGVYSAASFQANWFVAAGIAADAVTKIQLGLATSTAQTAAQSDIDDIQSRLPALLIDGRMDAYLGAAGPNTINASALAADAVTELQSGLALEQTQLSVKAVTDKLNPGLVASGPVWQFTANMLALGPSSSGGDATSSNQQVIIQHLEQIKGTGWSSTDTLEAIRDLVSAGVGSALATLGFTAGTITGFPTTLRVGDSYVSAVNRSITVFLRDQANTPITSLGSKNFSDADFAPSVTISQEGNAGRVETTVGWVPPANGNEGYLQIQIPSSASKSARVGAATVQVRLRWTGIDVTLATQAVTWLPAV
jgi:hypothetical protein